MRIFHSEHYFEERYLEKLSVSAKVFCRASLQRPAQWTFSSGLFVAQLAVPEKNGKNDVRRCCDFAARPPFRRELGPLP